MSYGLCDRFAKSRVAVENRDADLDFGDLPLKMSRHQGLAVEFDAVHLALDAASMVVSASSSPDRAAEVTRSIDRFVAGDGPGTRGLPGFGILAWRDHGMSPSRCNRVMAFARILSAVCGHRSDALIAWNLIE